MEIANNRVFANHGTLRAASNGTAEHPPGFIVGAPAPNAPARPGRRSAPSPGTDSTGKCASTTTRSRVTPRRRLLVFGHAIGRRWRHLQRRFRQLPVQTQLGRRQPELRRRRRRCARRVPARTTGSRTTRSSSIRPQVRRCRRTVAALQSWERPSIAISPTGQECGSVDDADCPPGLTPGVGPGLVIDANLIMGNSAESGSGGGIRLQRVNGNEVAAFPRLPDPCGTKSRSPTTSSRTTSPDGTAAASRCRTR